MGRPLKHLKHARHHASDRIEVLPLHLPSSESKVTPEYPVRVSLDPHHSVKKQGRLRPSVHNHLRPPSVRHPEARAAVRTWIAQRHGEHVKMNNTNHN